jgi:hypothetical protein
VDLVGETHLIEYLLEVEVVAADVESQFVEDHLELVFELLGAVHAGEMPMKDGVCEDFVPRDAVDLFNLKTLLQEIYGFGGEIFAFDEEGLFFDVSDELYFSVGRPGGLAVEEFVEDEAEGPDVAFGGVAFAFEDFEGHVERSAHHGGHHLSLVFHLFCEPEVAEFEVSSFLHDVGRLEVAE